MGEETCKKLKAYAEDGIWFRCGGVFHGTKGKDKNGEEKLCGSGLK